MGLRVTNQAFVSHDSQSLKIYVSHLRLLFHESEKVEKAMKAFLTGAYPGFSALLFKDFRLLLQKSYFL